MGPLKQCCKKVVEYLENKSLFTPCWIFLPLKDPSTVYSLTTLGSGYLVSAIPSYSRCQSRKWPDLPLLDVAFKFSGGVFKGIADLRPEFTAQQYVLCHSPHFGRSFRRHRRRYFLDNQRCKHLYPPNSTSKVHPFRITKKFSRMCLDFI